MATQKISNNLNKYSDAALLALALQIEQCITGNANFPTPNPSFIVLGGGVTVYKDALTVAADRSRKNVALKNAARKELQLLLIQLGSYITNVANGNPALLAESGFPLTKIREARVMGRAGNVTLTQGPSSGQLEASIDTVFAALRYLYQIVDVAPTEATVWSAEAVSNSKYTFTGLIPGKQYWVRVAAAGARGQLCYSPVATLFVQ